MVKQEVHWNCQLAFPLCFPIFPLFSVHTGWLACFVRCRLVLLDRNCCFALQSYCPQHCWGLLSDILLETYLSVCV